MGDPGTALVLDDRSFGAYLGGAIAMTLALGVAAANARPAIRWTVLVLAIPVAYVAFVVVAIAGAESWHTCAH